MSEEHYLQFPLGLLAMPGEWKTVAGFIDSHSIGEAFMCESGLDEDRKKVAAGKLGARVQDWGDLMRRYQKAADFVSKIPYSGAGDATVRLKTTLVFESRDGEGLDEREFKVLCAVYSALGRKEMRRITSHEVQRRAAGCVSRALFEKWAGKGVVYTPKQIRGTLDALHARGFYARATYARRLTYYSHRNTPEQLRDLIIARHSQPMIAVNADAAKDAAMTAEVAKLRAGQGQLTGN